MRRSMGSEILPPLRSIMALASSEEHDRVVEILDAVDSLDQFVQDFRLCVDLFNYCAAEKLRARAALPVDVFSDPDIMRLKGQAAAQARRLVSWCHIAARDAVMQIRHFCILMQLIDKRLEGLESLKTRVNRGITAAALESLELGFPNSKLVRDAVGHSPSELVLDYRRPKRSQKQMEAVVLGMPVGGRIRFSHTMSDNKYVVTKDGKTAFIEISQGSALRLSEAHVQFLSAFDNARKEVQADKLRAQREHGANPPT